MTRFRRMAPVWLIMPHVLKFAVLYLGRLQPFVKAVHSWFCGQFLPVNLVPLGVIVSYVQCMMLLVHLCYFVSFC